MKMHRCVVVTVVGLLALLLGLEALAEVRVVTSRRGDYRDTRVLTGGRTDGVWAPVTRRGTTTMLNPNGDRLGDLWPDIEENRFYPHHPWVVWSRLSQHEYELAYSRWTDSGWDPVRWVVDPGQTVGHNLDADLMFDPASRPFVVWWREAADGTGSVHLSMFLQTEWMAPFPVSAPGTDSRYPSLEIRSGGELVVRYDTPSGTVEQTVWFEQPDTITDDINPLDVMLPGSLVEVEEEDE
jgi:hypothetical protein